MKIKKGDTVLIISGKDRSRKSKVIRALPKERKIVVEGINLRKKHIKPKKSGEKGQIISFPAPLDISNVKLICPKCGKVAKVGYKIVSNKKHRICKKCGGDID
ncbi:MAG: 50S ribosomal protein L24 [Candidatus Nealsonbacteria bacterium CG03_land_8_20_14_0_80_36_12]|uniref:Large ribosomal subunit protein uL24 n=1 Tax=Candidatus Nealsonbacteria bacterium CG03_land_8_20_14_0_80_36_12 TaxID=1974701 RepID=A0A2M7BYN2_9BACT|nr:MAG: 50S ribosomal protein L24 [Candidatus Nealsonbacteria bacterium CG03_land_8_20_14_0_80_36_12]